MNKEHRHAWRSFVAEAGSTATLCVLFLTILAFRFEISSQSTLAHAIVLACLWIFFVATRIIIISALPRKAARWITSVAIFSWLGILILWYALIVIGLSYWGRIATLKVAAIYIEQAPALANVLGLPFFPLLAAGALVLLVLYGLILLVWPKSDWVTHILSRAGRKKALLLAFSAIGITGIQLHQMALSIAITHEPFGVSALPGAASDRFESHQLGDTTAASALEDQVRIEMGLTAHTEDPTNVILIVSDALRADHLGLYGYPRNTSPFLDELIKKTNGSQVIHNVKSSCAESNCGLLSLASSRRVSAIPKHPITLIEVLKRSGYSTHLILSGDHTNFYGLKEAYGNVDSYLDGTNQSTRYVNDDTLVLDAIERLPALKGNEPPFMLQLHFMSTHGLGLRKIETSRYAPSANYYKDPTIAVRSRESILAGINYYDNGVAQFDRVAHAALTTLSNKKYLSRTLVIITADHGEMLGEHGKFSHASQVNEPALNIPLVLVRYGYSGKSIEGRRVVAQVDIAPTILNDIGIQAPRTWTGIPLQSKEIHDFVYFQQGALSGVYDNRDPDSLLKYWTDLNLDTSHAFNISTDPAESMDITQKLNEKTISKLKILSLSGSLVSADVEETPFTHPESAVKVTDHKAGIFP
jgi:glucan phosphoethanolaminetransferase (alkaline phosphatase superfamily)